MTLTAAGVVLGSSGGRTCFRSVNLFAPRSITAPYSQRKSMPRMTSLEQSLRTTNFTGQVSPWMSTRAVHLPTGVMRCPPAVRIFGPSHGVITFRSRREIFPLKTE
uniref:Uncharacterized protein n=1 Tax=Ixodes ricinus TaxID=34613 RepID=A0A6B0U8X4_IXORI